MQRYLPMHPSDYVGGIIHSLSGGVMVWEIVQLSQGRAAGTRGALMWDGLNENGQKMPIGRYIAYIEASDAAGRSVQRHKTTVVVAR